MTRIGLTLTPNLNVGAGIVNIGLNVRLVIAIGVGVLKMDNSHAKMMDARKGKRMDVQIISATKRPLEVISIAAGTSYGKDNFSEKRVWTCWNNGHMSVFEHAAFTARIEGISRACSHQLVRHRMASFVQESQRYCKVSVDSDDWYVMPKAFDCDALLPDLFAKTMAECASRYQFALDNGIKPEDARFLLPEATKTNITMSMNVRELYHFLDLRMDKNAQWEIRNLADMVIDALQTESGQWACLVNMWLLNEIDSGKKGKHERKEA